MTLWGNLDNASGNQKPIFANTSNSTSNSTVNGTVANTAKFYGSVFGVSAGEQANVAYGKTVHPGWVSAKFGTGPVIAARINAAGTGVNSNGYLTITDTSFWGQGSGANIFFETANSLNSMQRFSTVPAQNVVGALTIMSGGAGYSNTAAVTVVVPGANTTPAEVILTFGGRAGRVAYETLVATGSITGDDTTDNRVFPGT